MGCVTCYPGSARLNERFLLHLIDSGVEFSHLDLVVGLEGDRVGIGLGRRHLRLGQLVLKDLHLRKNNITQLFIKQVKDPNAENDLMIYGIVYHLSSQNCLCPQMAKFK